MPPQPIDWYRNLITSMGAKIKIRRAFYQGRPAAGILTIRHKATMTYKYGCSDSRYHMLGPVQLLIWRAIQEAKEDGLLDFDLGRTDCHNEGLLTFKDRLGGTRSTLTYLRYPAPRTQTATMHASMRIARFLFSITPSSLLALAGNIFYPHID